MMNKKVLLSLLLCLGVLFSVAQATIIEETPKPGDSGPRQLNPTEVQNIKQTMMKNLLNKVQQNPQAIYNVSIQIWDKSVLQHLQNMEGVNLTEIYPRVITAEIQGATLERMLKEKLKGKYKEINLITLISDSSKRTSYSSGDANLLATTRSYKFSGGLSPPDDTEDWWALYVYSYEDRIDINSRIYDWLGCDVDLYLYDPDLNLRDQDTWDYNNLIVSSRTDKGGYWYWQYWGQYLDDDGTGYSGTVEVLDE